MQWKEGGGETREKKKRSDEDESVSNTCHLTYGLTRHALTHIHTEQVKLTVIYQSVKFSFIDPVKGLGFINYSNAALWLGVAAATQTFSDVISLCIFFPSFQQDVVEPSVAL